jgi:hypothetical protein
MGELKIERIGGLGGFGLPGSHLKGLGTFDPAKLSATDLSRLDNLFETGGAASPQDAADSFRYRITRQTPQGPQTIEAPHEALPEALTSSVKDTLV